MFNFIFKRTNGDPVLPKELINLIKVAHRPVIPPAQEIVNEQTLGDGTVVYQHTGVYEDRVIEVECNFIAESKRLWHDHLRQVQNALIGDTGTLSFTDDPDHYFKVKRVDLKDFTREYGRVSQFVIRFTCEPYRYVVGYQEPITVNAQWNGTGQIFYNKFDISEPLYRVYVASGIISTFRFYDDSTGESFYINNLHQGNGGKTVDYIDIDVARKTCIRYFRDGSWDVFGSNTSGLYEMLQIPQGTHKITFSTNVGNTPVLVYRRYREL